MVPINNDYSGITTRGISDPVFMHISRNFTIRELVCLKNVSKTISNLVSTNSAITARVRREDNTMDWYYPLYLHWIIKIQDDGEESHQNSDKKVAPVWKLMWSAVHRPSGDFHNLFTNSHLLPSGASSYSLDNHASVEGLLLMLLTHRDPSINWKPLVVTNPVTRKWRLLPTPDCTTLGFTSWNYGTFQLYMIADKPANAYKVILIHRQWLCVYKSTTNTWSSHILTEGFPFSIRYWYSNVVTRHYEASVVNGRIHFAVLEFDNDPKPISRVEDGMNLLERGQVSVYEVDDEAGTWKLGVQYKLQSYIPFDLYRNYKDYGFRLGSYRVRIVECMGCIYAIIPAFLDIYENVDEEFRRFHELGPTYLRYIDYGFQNLRFYILQLKGSVGKHFGQMVIRIPGDGRRCYVQYVLKSHESGYWYQCLARGSVIWVTVDDFVVQYDVLFRSTTIEVLQRKTLDVVPAEENVAFAPNLYMKPWARNGRA